jgi:hypothetical protein
MKKIIFAFGFLGFLVGSYFVLCAERKEEQERKEEGDEFEAGDFITTISR